METFLVLCVGPATARGSADSDSVEFCSDLLGGFVSITDRHQPNSLFKIFSPADFKVQGFLLLFVLPSVCGLNMSLFFDTFEPFPSVGQTEPVQLRGASIFTRCFGAL